MRRLRVTPFFAIWLLSLSLLVPTPALVGQARAQEGTPVATESGAGKVLLFAAPGLDADLAQRLAGEGALPAMAELLQQGAGAGGGLIAPLPATNGTAFTTLLTGTWPAENGVVGDRFYRTGSPNFADWSSWTDPGLLQADTLPQAAERADKQVVAIGWEGIDSLDPALNGPVIGQAQPLSQTGVLANFDLDFTPVETDRARLAYDR